MTDRRRPFDIENYKRRVFNESCFVCRIVAGELPENRVVYEDELAVAWLNPWPVLYG